MKKYVSLLIISVTLLSSLAAYGQTDSTPRLGAFDSVAIHIHAETVIVRGKERALDIEMSDSTARKVDIFNDRGTLVIKSKRTGWLRKSDTINIKITMPEWDSLTLSSSGTLRSDDFWSLDNAKIKSTGSCDITMNNLETRNAEFSLTGSGNLYLNKLMSSNSMHASSTGSGSLLIQGISTPEADIKLTGSGDMSSSFETGSLKVRLTGSGNIRMSGYATQAVLQTSGSGSINGADLKADEATIKITGSGDVNLQDDSRIKEIRMTGSGVFRSK